MSPAEWDTFGTMVTLPPLSRNYTLGDRESTGTEDEAVKRGGAGLLCRYLRLTEDAEVLPFTFQDYGSGGARMWATDEDDDDDPAGFFYADRAEIVKEYGDDSAESRAKARNLLTSECRTWEMYVEGDVVYGVIVKDETGAWVESIWGFYGSDPESLDELRAEGRMMAEWEREQRDRAANQDIATRAD